MYCNVYLMCLQCILIRFTSSIILPHPSSLLHTTVFFVLFSYTYAKYIYHIYPFTLSVYPLPSLWYSPSEKTCFIFLSFILYVDILTVQEVFTSHTCTSHMYILSFNQITPLYYLLFLYCPTPLVLNASSALRSNVFLHRCLAFQYYSIFVFIPFFSPTSL
jgi:hypothetical protein